MNRKRLFSIGSKIGDWVVLSEAPSKGSFHFWLCRCKCGFERNFGTNYLNTRQPTCCDNCKKIKIQEKLEKLKLDTIGKTYGNFTVIKYAGTTAGGHDWLCQCKCGYERIFHGCYLYGNADRRATQCKKCYIEEIELGNRITNEIPYRFWKRFLDHTKLRDIPVKITREEAFSLYEKQNKKCALSGVDLYFTKLRSNFNRYTNASLDRIDSDKPYTKENIQWVHKEVNMMKYRFSQEQFLNWCKKIIKYHRSKNEQ